MDSDAHTIRPPSSSWRMMSDAFLRQQAVARLALGERELGGDLLVDVAQTEHETVGVRRRHRPAAGRREPPLRAVEAAQPEDEGDRCVRGGQRRPGRPRRRRRTRARAAAGPPGAPVPSRWLGVPRLAHVTCPAPSHRSTTSEVLGQHPEPALGLHDALPPAPALGRVAPGEGDAVAAAHRSRVGTGSSPRRSLKYGRSSRTAGSPDSITWK